jgi:hypothetical protein
MIVKRFLVLVSLMVVLVFSPALAANRVALVIGNDNYKSVRNLNNAGKDARDIARKLEGLGFEVILKIDATRRDMARAMRTYETKASSSEVGLIFFAGHGIQTDGMNYLIPSDAEIEIEDDLAYQGINAKDFLQTMERAGTPINIMILDACRDNPLPKRSRSAARGLSLVGIPKGAKGTAILYSAGEGQKAADGPIGENGVFTSAFLMVLDVPNLTLEQSIKRVVRRVKEKTNGRQRPWSLISLEGDFYFKPELPKGSGTVTTASPDVVFWQSVKGSKNPDVFKAYLSNYPDGIFAELARIRIKELEGSNKKRIASLRPSSVQIETLDGTYVALKTANVRASPSAQSKKVGQVKIDTGLSVTGKVKGTNWYRVAHRGSTAFIFGPLVREIDKSELEVWKSIKDAKKWKYFEAFLVNHPSGHFAARAKRLREALKPKQVVITKPVITSPKKPEITPLMRRALRAAEMARDTARLAQDTTNQATEAVNYARSMGRGVMSTSSLNSDGSSYEGELKDGKLHGHGVYKWSNGMRYAGEWRYGKKSGFGIQTWLNGQSYSGKWWNNLYNIGVLTWHDGRRYEGQFGYDESDVFGVLTYANGSVEYGGMKNGAFVVP